MRAFVIAYGATWIVISVVFSCRENERDECSYD